MAGVRQGGVHKGCQRNGIQAGRGQEARQPTGAREGQGQKAAAPQDQAKNLQVRARRRRSRRRSLRAPVRPSRTRARKFPARVPPNRTSRGKLPPCPPAKQFSAGQQRTNPAPAAGRGERSRASNAGFSVHAILRESSCNGRHRSGSRHRRMTRVCGPRPQPREEAREGSGFLAARELEGEQRRPRIHRSGCVDRRAAQHRRQGRRAIPDARLDHALAVARGYTDHSIPADGRFRVWALRRGRDQRKSRGDGRINLWTDTNEERTPQAESARLQSIQCRSEVHHQSQ